MKSFINAIWGPLLLIIGIVIYNALKSSTAKNDKTHTDNSNETSGSYSVNDEVSVIVITVVFVLIIAILLIFIIGVFR